MQQADSILREAVSRVLSRMLNMPEGTLITVSHIRTAPDLHSARVFFTVFPGERTAEVHAALRRAQPDIQKSLAEQVQLKYLPRLHFVADVNAQKTREIENLLDELSRT
ncbi:MAG: ribosome-binding factor A [Parcubacteria group bacterium CG2_30_48_51]|nr:MAG: ribosome-binding factor A [Parcubacteria group bacterium CG2_30_48_51]